MLSFRFGQKVSYPPIGAYTAEADELGAATELCGSLNLNSLKVAWDQLRYLRVGILRRSLTDPRAALKSL